MRRFLIRTIKYVIGLIGLAMVILPIWYNFNYDYLTTMQLIKKFWFSYVIATVCGIFYLVLETFEEDY
jgi:hypothetical protein